MSLQMCMCLYEIFNKLDTLLPSNSFNRKERTDCRVSGKIYVVHVIMRINAFKVLKFSRRWL
jgi:hypothetical protein